MLRRLLETLATLLVSTVVVFSLIRIIPGDPAQAIMGEKATAAALEAARERYGLDRPLYEQFFVYLGDLFQGDLGTSIQENLPVSELIATYFPATLELSLLAMLIASVMGILLGVFAAKNPGGLWDSFLGAFSVFGLSIPIFFLGLLLALIFGQILNWLPYAGRLDPLLVFEIDQIQWSGLLLVDSILAGRWDIFQSALSHLILPAVALSTIPMSLLARLTRSALLESLSRDFIRTARAKGQTEWRVFFIHALKNALLPVITMVGFQFGLLLGGAILTETVFSWPGMGKFLVTSVERRDYPSIQGGLLFFVLCITLVMTLTDLILRWVDPRLRVQEERS